jgi:lipopolysaccharide export system protein LptA
MGRAVFAQETQRCYFDNTPNTRQTSVKLPSGEYNNFFGAGVFVRCPAKSLTLRSDSLESYGDEGRIYLLGSVRYDDPKLALTSDYLTYYRRDERIVANGNVNTRLPNGSTLKGPVAEYLRAIPGTRPVPRLLATGRPAITIIQKDSTGKATEPTTVLANSVSMVGDSLVYAGGSVVVTRQEVIARGDSMALDSQREITVMLRGPSIEGRRDRPFTLSGERIELTSRNRKLERVIAKGKGKAVSEDLTLTSDTIDLRIADDLLQRAMAWGPARARAHSPTQQLLSDSIDVSMPGQRVREMHAVRRALAEGRPDSTRFKADTVDWMRGDTIVARFDTVAASDTSRTARMKELVALGHAKSYHHMPPSDSLERRAAINYVVGKEIIVAFLNQRVSKVTVIEQAAGVYLEPKAESAPADTTRARATPVPPPRSTPASVPPAVRPNPRPVAPPPGPPQ